MYKIEQHPILEVREAKKHPFSFNGTTIEADENLTIAAALHRAGLRVHSHSLTGRCRSVACGIGKCGACEMLVDGSVKRICITKVEGIKEVKEIPPGYIPKTAPHCVATHKVYRTDVAIVGAGPAGLSAREELNRHGIDNLVIDSNSEIGGQFLMQTHRFFFFEKEQRFGGMRGFEICHALTGNDESGIMLNSTVWDILEGNRLAVKNTETGEICFVDARSIIVAAGAVPFMPAFENDDLPGVYTAAVIQKMMNREFTLLGKNVLTVGAGNIGYLTSYQLKQAGAHVKAILEAMPSEGGFPVQANRVRRLGIPILTSHLLLKAVPNADGTAIAGAVIAKCDRFKPVPGTEQLVEGIDAINICTGLIPDSQLLEKGRAIFGDLCFGAGDALRIGEGTSAVLRGRQAAFDAMKALGRNVPYEEYLSLSKAYIESQQHPVRRLDRPHLPDAGRMGSQGFVTIECLYGFACNPCSFACPQHAITKSDAAAVPDIDFTKCVGCMECISRCPGLAIFGYDIRKDRLFLPVEYAANEKDEVFLVDNNGAVLGEGVIEKIMHKAGKTNVCRIKAIDLHRNEILAVKGFIVKEEYPEPLQTGPMDNDAIKEGVSFLCHCEDVDGKALLEAVGERTCISIDELKHTSRIGMGPCRGKRCIPRAKQFLRARGITVVDTTAQRAPLSNPLTLSDVLPGNAPDKVILATRRTIRHEKVKAFIAGGGMAGSALFRYMAEAGFNPVMANNERGSTWRCIAGGRPAFSHPAIADIAKHNLAIFKELKSMANIDFKPTRYVTFAHDEATFLNLERSSQWSDARMIEKKDFRKEISEHLNPNLNHYSHASISQNCWQATPGKVLKLLRDIAVAYGGVLLENAEVLDVERCGNEYRILVTAPDGGYIEYLSELFVNAMGGAAGKFASRLGIETGLYPVRHQAFITRRMPLIGKNGDSLDMLIDRRHHRGFSAVYGQQMKETGQIIGCASPAHDPQEVGKCLKTNTKDFLNVVAEVFCDWIPSLKDIGIQAVWAGYYTEPRYIVDPELGLLAGLRGHGFMLGQYLAKLYLDALLGKPVPDYFKELSLSGKGLDESAFK